MFGSSILDVAIGMVLVYLILSLVVTSLNEMVASFLKLRAENLADGIRELLGDGKGQPGVKVDASAFFKHPIIDSLSKGPDGKPSYIPSRTFALAVLDLVTPAQADQARSIEALRAGINGLPDGLKRTLTVLLDDAGHDVEKFKAALEVWFNNCMVRVAGWYKRKSAPILFVLALIVTVLFNVDSLRVASELANDKTLRDSVVAQAQQIAKKPLPDSPSSSSSTKPIEEFKASASQMQDAVGSLSALKLPIGWTEPTQCSKRFWFNRVCGWLLTTFAVSLGAPFWFDLLNRFMNIRNAGRAPEEKAKDPQREPKAQGAGAPMGDAAAQGG